MSKEDFNYRGYLLDLGYEENEIPAEFTDEEKDQLYAQAIQGTYNAYLEQEKNLDPNASKKERVIAATKRMIEDIPEAREALGIPEEITDQQEPYDLVKFADFVASTSPGETNFDEPVQNYLESYSKTLYNDMTPLVRPFLQNVEKSEFKKHFMEANGIDKDTTVNDVMQKVRIQKPSGPTLGYEVEPEKKGFGSALVSGFKGFWDMTTGDTKRALGYAFDRPDWVQEGMLSQMLGEAEKRQYNFVPKYDGVVETWREVYEKEGFFSALKSATGAAVESGAANTAATAYIFGTQVLTNLAMGALGVALTPASGGTGAVAAAASGAKAFKGLKDIAKLILSSKGYVSNAAAIGVTGAMMIGEPMRRAIDEGVFDPEKSGEALLFGLASTGLEYGGFLAMRGAIGVRKGWNKLTDTELFKKIYGRAPVAGEVEATKSWAKKYLIPEAVGVLGGAVEEGATEMGQDLLAMWYSNRSGADISFEEGWKDSWNAFWSAVPLGGGMRLAGSVPRIAGSIWQEGAEKRVYDRNGGVLAGADATRGSDMSAFNPAALAATQIFRTENGKSIVSYGGTTIEHDGDANQAMMNLIAARKVGLEPIEKGEDDANITVNDNNTEASIPFREGGGVVTYKGENAKERLSELVDEHNDMASSPFMLTEGMTIEEEKKDGKTTYWVTFPNDPLSPNGAPFKRGVDNLHSRYATNPNGGFAAAYVQEIPVSVARAQARGVPMSAVESGQNVPGDVLFLKNTENPSGNGSRELTLFDRSRNVIYRASVSARDSEGKRRVSLSAKTHLGKTLKLDDNVRNQVVEDGGQINLGAPTFGFSATRTETAGKESYHLDLDQAKEFAESIGATFDEENSTMEKVEFTTASGRKAVVRVVPPKGTLLVEYNGDVVEVRSGVFDLADMENFQDTGRPVFGLFGYDFEDATGSSENPVIRRVWKNANGQNRVTLLYYNQNGELVGRSDNLMPEEETEEMTEEEVNAEITSDTLSDIFPTRFRRGYAIKSADGDGAANYLDDNGEYTSDPSEAALFDRATAEAVVASEERAGRPVVPVSYYEFFGADEDGNIDYNDRIFEIGDTENDEISSDFKNQVIIKGQDVLLAFGAFAQEVEDLSQVLSDENLEASFNARGEDPIASLTDEELNTLRNVTEVSVIDQEDEVDDLDLSDEDFTLEDEEEIANSQDPRAPKHALVPRVTPTDRSNPRRSQMLDTEGFNFLQEVITQEKARRDSIAHLRGKTPEPVEEGNNRLLELAGKWNTMTDNEKLKGLLDIIVRYYFLSKPLYRGKDSDSKQQSFSSRIAEFIGKLQEDDSISPNWKYSFREAMIIPQVQERLRKNGLGYVSYEKGRRVILPAESDNTGATVYGFVRITNKPEELFVKNSKGENIYYTIVMEENEATLFDTKTEGVFKGVYDNLRKLNGEKQITDFAYRVNYKKTRNKNKRQWDIKSFSADLKIPEGVVQTTSLKSISDTHSQSPLDDLSKHLDKIEEDAVRKVFDNHLGVASNETKLTEGVLKKIEEFKKKFGLAVPVEKNITLGETKLRLREAFFKYYKRDGDVSYSARELPQEIEGNKEEIIYQKEREAIRERHILREMVDVFNRKLMGNVKNNNTPIQRKFTSEVIVDLRGDSYAGTIYTITYDDGTSEGKRVISETNFNEAKEKAYWLFFEKYLDYFTKLGRKLQGNGNFSMSLRNERSETVVDFTRVENGEVKTDVIRKENRSTIDFIGYVSGIAMNSFFQAAERSQHPDIASGNNRPVFQKLYRDAVLRILENRLNKTDFKLRRYADGRGVATAKIFYEPSTTQAQLKPQLLRTYNILGSNKNLFNDLSDIIDDVDMLLRWSAVRASTLAGVEEGTPEANLQGFHNHSGGARGADTAWGHIGRRFGVETTNWYPSNTNKPTDLGGFELDNVYTPLSDEQEAEGLEKAKTAWDKIRPPRLWARDTKEQAFTRRLWARSWFQVKNAEKIFAVGVLTGLNSANASVVESDTAAAVQMAMDNGQKPIYFYNQSADEGVDVGWYEYSYADRRFKRMTVLPVLSEKFAGIGTREINGNGWAAIADVYRNTVYQRGRGEAPTTPSEPVSTAHRETSVFDFYKAYFGTQPVENDNIDEFFAQQMNNVEDLPSNSVFDLFEGCCKRGDFQIRFVRVGEKGNNQLYFLSEAAENNFHTNIEKVIEKTYTVDQVKNQNIENKGELVPVYILTENGLPSIVEANFRDFIVRLWNINSSNNSIYQLINEVDMVRELYQQIASTNPDTISIPKNKDASVWNWKQPSKRSSNDTQDISPWLSNFVSVSEGIVYGDNTYDSVEAAYQAAKVDYCRGLTSEQKITTKRRFAKGEDWGLYGGLAKLKGRDLEKGTLYRFDSAEWGKNKERILGELVEQKFLKNQEFQDRLLRTGMRYIVEGHAGNKEWGAVWTGTRWDGENKMGKILMGIRQRLAQERVRSFGGRFVPSTLFRSTSESLKRQREAFSEAISKSPGAPDTLASFRFFDSREGMPKLYEDTGLMSPDGARARSIEDELVAHYGESILTQVASGQIVILENQEAARNFWNRRRQDPIYSADGVFQGFCDRNGVIYLVRDGIRDGDVHKVVVHEKGVHAGFLGFTRSRDFQAILQYLRDHIGDTTSEGLAIKRAFERAYRMTKDPDEVWIETLAYLCEENADNQYNIIQRFIATVKKWLFEHGILDVSRFSVDDFVIFAQAAARAPLRQEEMERYDALASRVANKGIDNLFGENFYPEVLKARDEARRFIDLMLRKGVSPFSNRGYDIFRRYMQIRGIDYFEYSRGNDPANINFLVRLQDGSITENFIRDFKSYGNKFYNFFRLYNGKAFMLEQIYENDKLFIAYPELKDVSVILTNKGGTYFNSYTNIIYVDSVQLFGFNKKLVKGGFINSDSMLDVLSWALEHEIFHKIQYIEGYSGGNNEEIFKNFIKNGGVKKLETYMKENYSSDEISKFLRSIISYHVFGDILEERDEKLLNSLNSQFNLDNSFLNNTNNILKTIKENDSLLYDFIENNNDTKNILLKEIFSYQDEYTRLNKLLTLLKEGNIDDLRSFSEGELQADKAKIDYIDKIVNEQGTWFPDKMIEDVILTEDLKSSADKLGINLNAVENTQNIIEGTTNTTEEGTDLNGIDSKTAVDEQLYVKTQSIRDDILQDSEFARILETIDTLKGSHPEIYAEIEQQGGDNLFAAMFAALMNKQDTLRDPVLSSLLLRAKDFLHKVTERKEFFGQPKEKTNLSSENMKAMVSAISGVPRPETLSSTATTPEEAFAVQTNSILLEQMALPPQNTFLEYVQEEINSMLDLVEGNFSYGVEVIDGVETPVIYENGQPGHILKGVAPAHAQGAVEHLVFRGRVTENKRPSDTEQENPFWYDKLLKPFHALAPQDFSNVQAKLDPGFVDKVLNALPAHIRERIEIHSNPTDPRTRELLLKHNSHGIFLPMSAARKTIHIRDFNISKEQFIRTVSEEIGHYSWQLFGNSQMDEIVDEMYRELELIIEDELKKYLPKGGVRTTFDRLNLINEFFSKYGVNFLDNNEINDLFSNESFSERFKNKYNIENINNLRKQILDEVGTIATNMNVAVFSASNNSTNEDFKQFFEQLLITLMSPAHGKAVVASFPRGDGRVTEIRVNDWGQMRRIRPKTAEAAIRQKIMEIVNQQPSDFGKWLVMQRFDNLPFNFYSPQWFVNFLGRFIDFVSFGALRNSAEWIRIPGGFTGDTVVGKDVSILLSRAYQSIYSDYGLRMKKEYVNMTKFADYLRRNNLNPDLVDKAKGYVAFMQENGLDDKKMLEMAREADVFMQEGVRRIEDNVLRIRQEFMNTLNSLRLWGARYNLTPDAMRKIEKEVNDVMKNFKQNYSHRAYRAYTPEDRANINEMQQYLMEEKPMNFLSNKLAEANRKKAEAKLEFDKSQKTPEDYTKYRKATKEANHLQYIYNRLAGLQEYASAVVTGTAKRIDNELDIDLSEIVGMGSNYTQQTHELMKKIIEKIAYKNLETRKNKQDKQHSRFNVIAGVMRRKFDEKNSWERGYITFLDEIKNPMESVLLSLDQQEKILNKLAFNRILGEKILETGMGYFKLDPDKVLSPGMTKIGFGEKGTFLSFLGLETFFDKAFEKEYDVASKMTDNAVWARYFAMTRANLTVYNPKLAISNYISNIGVGFATGHLFRMANVIGGMPIIRDDFLKRFKGREANPNAFQKQILDELVRYQVIGGSSSSTEMKIYTHNNHEKLISWLTSALERVTPLSQAGKFSMDNFLFNLLEKAREIYGYGDEWLKIIAYLNNREMAMAKYEAEFDSSDPNYQRNVREAAAKDAANLTQLEMTTWELSPMMIRQLAGSSMRILTPDFIMHNFQILRMTTVALGRLMEIGSEIRQVSSIQNRTPAQDKYLALLGFEMARRGAGTVVGATMLGTLILCPAYLIPYLATVFVPGLFGGGDDGRPDDENRHSFTTAEHTGAQMLLNSLMDATNLWAPAYRKDKYTFLATNHQRQDAAQTLFAPPPATETPTLAQYGVNQAKMIIDLGSDNILGQVYNGLRGKDRYGQQVGFMKAFKELAARGVVPEAINQAVFTGSALTNWALEGEAKGRTINEMLTGKPARQQLAHKSWELVGASVREYDIRDMASSRAYEIKQGIGNAQNPVRRDFIEDVVNNPNMSDSAIVSKIEKMMRSNEQRMGRAAYAVNGLRNWGLSDKEIIKYFNKGRNAPGTTILSEADARKIVEGKNIYDYHILTALQEKRDTFAGKLGDDSKYTREQRQRIVDTIDRFMAKYKEMMGEGVYVPSGRKTPRRRDSEQPTGNPRYNRGTNSGSPIVRQNVVATGEGNLVINSVYDGDTFKGTRRGQLFSYRIVNMDAREMGQEGGAQDRAAMMSLIAGSDNVRLKPIMRDKYGRIVVEAYVGDKLLAEEMIGRGNAREYFTDRNVNDPEMVARLRAATEKARVAGLTPIGQTAEQFRRESGG